MWTTLCWLRSTFYAIVYVGLHCLWCVSDIGIHSFLTEFQKECKECLVILLYCAMIATTPTADLGLSFALPYAINLAEAGVSVSYKRIGLHIYIISTFHLTRRPGYLFCTEVMPPGYSQQLLLVNTLRKVPDQALH